MISARHIVNAVIFSMIAISIAGCSSVDFEKKGDQAAALDDWKNAEANYRQALSESPSNIQLQRKYVSTKAEAIRSALAIAKACQKYDDYECALDESEYVLSLAPSNLGAMHIRSVAKEFVAAIQLTNARDYAVRGDYLAAFSSLAKARDLSTDPQINEQASTLERDISPSAATYAKSLMEYAEYGSLEERLEWYRHSEDILRFVVEYMPEQRDLFAEAIVSRNAAEKEKAQLIAYQRAEKQRQLEQQAFEKELAEKNRSRTVSILGVTVSSEKTDGSAWDGIARASEGRDYGSTNTLANTNIYGAITAALADSTMDTFRKPDVFGTASLYQGGFIRSRIQIPMTRDNFTPQWSGVQWRNVNIESDSTILRIVLFDADKFNEHDPIGIYEVTGTQLRQVAAAGGIVDIPSPGNRQLLYLSISVF